MAAAMKFGPSGFSNRLSKASSSLSQPVDSVQRKLPIPLVFWSDYERDAFRRNRAAQTRLNEIMDELANQRKNTCRSIRYEAHKFRQRKAKQFRHLTTNVSGNYSQSPVNLTRQSNNVGETSDVEKVLEPRQNLTTKDESRDNGVSKSDSSKKFGLATRAKKSVVTRTMVVEAQRSVDDVDNAVGDNRPSTTVTIEAIASTSKPNKPRSMSVIDYNDVKKLSGKCYNRQKSAFPDLALTDKVSHSAMGNNNNRPNTQSQNRRSDNYFDKCKAACQLRQDLVRRAKQRQRGVISKSITIQDVLNFERAKYVESREHVLEFIGRLEQEKRKMPTINRWTKDEIVSQLQLR